MPRFNKAKDISVGVVGYGGAFNMGKDHLELMKTAGMTPTAVAEIDPPRLAAAQQEFPGIEVYPTVTAMLRASDVRLITIITPHNTHAKLALQCLRAGRHVVTEKPFAVTTAECDRMIAEARKRRLMLSTYHNRHWDGCILEAVRQIRKRNTIGDVVRIEAHVGEHGQPSEWWRSSKSISGGILYDWGVHFLEYALQLIDAPIVEVTGMAKTGFWAPHTRWKKDTNEDEAFAVVRFKTGQWLTLCITRIDSNPKQGWLEITGTKGSYVFDGSTWTLIRKRSGRTEKTTGDNPPSRWRAYYRNVADHLTRGEPLVITPQWARRPIHILDLADRSTRKGAAVKAKYG